MDDTKDLDESVEEAPPGRKARKYIRAESTAMRRSAPFPLFFLPLILRAATISFPVMRKRIEKAQSTRRKKTEK